MKEKKTASEEAADEKEEDPDLSESHFVLLTSLSCVSPAVAVRCLWW